VNGVDDLDYFLIALFQHAIGIENKVEGGKVRENWVRKPYGRDSIELGTHGFIKDSQMKMGDGLTSGSLLKYQVSRRENTTKNPARKDAVNSSGMSVVQRPGSDGGMSTLVSTLMLI
jgi:hypothetical protein